MAAAVEYTEIVVVVAHVDVGRWGTGMEEVVQMASSGSVDNEMSCCSGWEWVWHYLLVSVIVSQ